MTTTLTTRPRLAALPHKDIAAALDVLAVMFEHADMPAKFCPDQAPSFAWHTESATAVRELAARLGVEVREDRDASGAVHTSFEYGIGRGVDLDNDQPAYASALVLRVVHIAEVSA